MKYLEKLFALAFLIIFLNSCGVSKSIHNRPDVSGYDATIPEKIKINDSTFVAGDNFLLKNKQGQWELYVEGNPLQIGEITGSLTQDLMQKQEAIFFNKVEDLVPSKTQQYLLRKFLAWYNRKMYLHIPEEYKAEIYGLSQFSSSNFSEIGEPYLRLLYLHGAHDIGHAMQDLMLVGCSSFAVWGDKTVDGELLIGRNFDFYAGDDFAKEKIIAFVNPSEGHKFMSVTWGGMIGVVSGMNDQGLTVTINAGKSEIPLVAKTPISVVTREILQYASTIDEAIEIAKKREVFVSEAIFVGSAKDKKAAIIEVAPDNFGVYEVENTDELICSNHFQSEAYKNDERNLKWIEESHSMYRFERMEELISEDEKLNVADAVAILRNKKGLDDKEIGYGNEKALNQLLAHHGIVFKPESRKVWVSSNPYQLGEFVEYDLNEIFKNREGNPATKSISNAMENISEDPFVYSKAYKDYEEYRILEREVEAAIENKKTISAEKLTALQQKNPEYWKAYYLTGKYYFEKKYDAAAKIAFEKALNKEITTVPDKEKIEDYLKKLGQ
ncbi:MULTISPECIES: C45 family autoproteolytic acyltransferase/hydolase [Aequorivita]|uniref:Acyl-CoA--6-aminopenicillanic acid acyl-transferase n=1 Tax=Aequorivita iocasae TaxID=2803865 RepID=A0ABX7DYQ6_9FLAO|nr:MULTISPECIES: C45 family peptidase [Aequorivita]QQX77884.1 acyl-CoA--6-aminopenicillanic acid acyl-transferase [Aequorivita iocasae]UCA57383.1 C45 family peptidase [Aequorivita sp. F7]